MKCNFFAKLNDFIFHKLLVRCSLFLIQKYNDNYYKWGYLLSIAKSAILRLFISISSTNQTFLDFPKSLFRGCEYNFKFCNN